MDHDACADADLPEGAMRGVEIDGRAILLTRSGGVCHAVSGTCPHAGAKLAEGVLHEGVVTCPWHKAAFDVATGARLEPPAVDCLDRYAVRVAEGRILVSDTAAPASAVPAAAPDPRCFVIVGAGAGGAVAAQTLREEGFSGRVVMIGQEDRLPYDRTVLSKYALSGKQGGEKSPLQDAAFYQRHAIERCAATVSALDAGARTLTFADGRQLAFDAALVATGGVPRALHVPGHDLPGVHTLRTPADVEAILASAAGARHAVVVGAGYIGLEAAGSLRERGLDVTVVAPDVVPLGRVLGDDVGGVFRLVHERHGVRFRLGAEVAAIEGDGRVRRVVLDDGDALPADLVLAGLGIAPATGLLRGAAIRDDGGVDVDAHLRLTDGLYAAGDIAAFPLGADGERIRVEHWRVAQQHGRVAALNMLGRAVAYDAVPYFWTIHYMQRLDYVGHAAGSDDVTIEGDLHQPAFLAFYAREGVVRAVAGWGRDRQMAAAIRLMGERRDWDLPTLRTALS